VSNTKSIGRILLKGLAFMPKAAHFADIRRKPQIPLKNIILSFCLIPILKIHSLLQFDQQWSRESWFKKLFGKNTEKRKMVSSDSTLQRVARWIDPAEAKRFQESFLPEYRKLNAWDRPLVPHGRSRKIGVIDGSVMNKHYLVALALYGKIVYPVRLAACSGRGMELTEAKTIIQSLVKDLGPSCPELLLFDGLYFASTIFEPVRENGMHILVKCGDPEFRTLFKDAKFLFDAGSLAGDAVIRETGYDENRLCTWKMEKTSDTFAGYPVLVVHLVEDYAKDKKNPHRESWIVTSDLSLSLGEIREAAHARWSIENDVFKKLSGLAATKHFRFNDQQAFMTMLMLFCAAVTAFELALQILAQNEKDYKAFLDGMKDTVSGVFWRVFRGFRVGIFR
jgi:hypothetical protein